MSRRGLRGPTRLLVRALAPRGVRDAVEGDLAERHQEIADRLGRAAARRWLIWQIVALGPWRLGRGARTRTARGGSTTEVRSRGRGLGSDVRLGLRALRLRPGTSLTVIVTVGLAVGATTSVFSVVDGVLLRPLAYPEPGRLARVWQTKESWFDSPSSHLRTFADRFSLSVPTFGDWTRAETGFESLGAWSTRSYVYQGPGGAEALPGQAVTSGFFDALGVEPILGRRLLPTDDDVGAARVVVLDERMWGDRFGRDPGVIGTSLRLDGEPHEVVGVMPAGFQGPEDGALLWAPLTDPEKQDDRGSQFLSVVGRLSPGVTLQGAAERLATVQTGLAETYPGEQGDVGSRVERLLDSVVGDVRPTLWFLLGAVALVLVVATLNIANVLAVLGLARRREMAVKAALGAGSGRLMRGLFVESAVLAAVGGVLGIVLAWVGLPLLLRLVPDSVPRYGLIEMSPGVLAFGLAITALTTVLVGTLPAVQASAADPQEMMRPSTRGATTGRAAGRVRAAMVSAEVSLAFVLLVAAGLLGTSYVRLWTVDRGFVTQGLVLMSAIPDPDEYPAVADRARFVRELRARLADIPGVSVTAANQAPLSGSTSSTTYQVERPDGDPEDVTVLISVGLDNYLSLLGIPLEAGRGFATTDGEDSPPVGIVSRSMADALWPGESPLGKRVRSGDDGPWIEVVGVAANVLHQGLAVAPEAKLYLPAEQSRRFTNTWILRVRGDVAAAVEAVRAAVAEQSPTTPVRRVQILEETIAASVAVPRFRTFFVVGLASLAALLALIGVYGVVTFAVTQRTREIGVRMALGADHGGVVREVVASGLRLALAGVVVGICIAWPGTKALQGFLFHVTPTDPATFLAIGTGVIAVSAVAAWLPARRAATVDPVSVLNSE